MYWDEVVALTLTHDGLLVKARDGRHLLVALGARTRPRFQKPAFAPAVLAEIRSRAPAAVKNPPRRG